MKNRKNSTSKEDDTKEKANFHPNFGGRIYLDYAATTPIDKDVLNEILPYFTEKFGNPMSVHSFGQEVSAAIDSARSQIASFLSSSQSEIVFTSGATESNNLAIKGILKSYYSQPHHKNKKPHIITTKFEHHCILDACQAVEREGMAEVTYISIDKEGLINSDDVRKSIKDNTILVSVMYVNNEIGTIQPIEEIGEIIKSENENRNNKILFHTDATQAVNYLETDVEDLGVDLLSFSGHKIYGPKGIGVLYVRKGTHIKRIQDGGEQEYKMRAGTHNVPGIVGIGKAISLIDKKVNAEMTKMRDYLIGRILKEIPDSYLNGSQEKRSPNNANFRFDNVEGEGLILSLDIEGIAASTGSACSSGALEPSHVLLALGLKHEEAHGSLRLTIGKYTTKDEIDHTVEIIKETVQRLRRISGDVLEEFKK